MSGDHGAMTEAIRTALGGMQAAESRVAIRAQNIANLNTPDYTPQTPVQTAGPAGPVVRAEPVAKGRAPVAYLPPGLTPASSANLAEDIVDMRLAAAAYGAALAVVQVSEEMSEALLDVVT